LSFVPIVTEAYFLVCDRSVLESTPGERLRAVLASAEWREALEALPGYSAEAAGSVVSLRRTLPWLS
jgi:putative molybdopterin biosynthesis protein